MRRTRLKLIAALAATASLAFVSGVQSAENLAQQSSSDRGVTVRVKPIDVASTAGTWSFDIVLETHSQELSDDLMRVATLNGGSGARSPTAWEGDPPGGHHRKGVLRFAPIKPAPDAVELRIQRPGENAPRSFRWRLE